MILKRSDVVFTWGFYTSFRWEDGKAVYHGHGSEGHTEFKPSWKDKLKIIGRIIAS